MSKQASFVRCVWLACGILVFVPAAGVGAELLEPKPLAEDAVAEKSAQLADGRIVFCALDARMEGDTARLESQPGHPHVGFWTNPKDAVSWQYKPTRWGRYDVELAYAAEGGDGTELAVEIAGQTLSARRLSTGSWSRYATLPVGRVYIAKAEPFTVRVRCHSLAGGAVMNLHSVLLRPAPEGEPIVQEPVGGGVILRARDAITHSTVMRYEPATNKNCLGYWVNPRDWAEWRFELTKPGAFEVELWQGCGRGQGGSDVEVETAGAKLSFQVEDTGHFQNFVPRQIGRVTFGQAGQQTLLIRPARQQAGAVMDIREVRLVPVTPAIIPKVP